MPLTAQDVAEITRLLEESDFDELHLEQDGLKLTLKRGAAAGRTAPAGAAPAAAAPAGSVEGGSSALDVARSEAPPSTRSQSIVDVPAPLVGIFYRAPRPGAPPYVEVGTTVEEDTIVGIIEVMKLMNAVRAEVRGTVCEILVKDGAAVEYAQVLLRVERGGQGG